MSEWRTRCERRYAAMGGEFAFMSYPQNLYTYEQVENLFDEAFDEVKRIEAKLTDFKSGPFNLINELAGMRPCPVDKEIFELIEKSLSLSKESNGVFDISYASIGHAWREAKQKNKFLSENERQELLQFVDYRKIEIDRKYQTVFLPHQKMRIGLGGIGKGYAVDKAFEFLKSKGLSNFYVNGSGDIRVHSHAKAPRKWKIGIRNPFAREASKSAGVIQLSNGSVASSGGYVHRVENADHRPDHHILKPKTGRSGIEIIAATVLASDCVEADTSATIIMNLTLQQAHRYTDERQLFAVWIDREGRSYLSTRGRKGLDLGPRALL